MCIRDSSMAPDIADDAQLAMTYTTYWRLLSAINRPSSQGTISRTIDRFGPIAATELEQPSPDIITILDPTLRAPRAARRGALVGVPNVYGAEILDACIEHESPFFVGHPANAQGPLMAALEAAGLTAIHIQPR